MNAPVARTQPPLVTATGQLPSLKEVKSLGQALDHPELKKLVAQSLPRHLSPERMLRTFVLAVRKTPKLVKADVAEVVGAMLTLASLGLEPNTPLGHAYMIPFEKGKKDEHGNRPVTIQVIIGYQGYLELARRTGEVKAIHADVVYEGDEFSFEYGTDTHLRHKPIGDREGRRPLYAYAHATLKDGGQAFEVLPYSEILRIRNGSQGYQAALRFKDEKEAWKRKAYDEHPWVLHEHMMAEKTMIRRIAKRLPLSLEFANALALDAMSEGGRIGFGAASSMVAEGVMDFTMLEHDPAETVDFGEQDERELETVERTQATEEQPRQQTQQQRAAPEPAGDPRDAEERDQQSAPQRAASQAASTQRRRLTE